MKFSLTGVGFVFHLAFLFGFSCKYLPDLALSVAINTPGVLPYLSPFTDFQGCVATNHCYSRHLPFTMLLLQLPPEILKTIFDQIGSSFFHENLDRLTVCKHWFEFALPMCFTRIKLSQETLRRLVNSGAIERQPALKDNLETLEIELELRGYQPGSLTSSVQEHAQESEPLDVSVPNEAPVDDEATTWIEALNHDLAQLAVLAKGSQMMRALQIRAWRYPSPEPLDDVQNSLSVPAMKALLSPENLGVLVLDISCSLLDPSGQQGHDHHICPSIGSLLPNLRTLHLRMRSICPDVLKVRDTNQSLGLRVVVVNLSLTTSLPGITSAAHSKRCGSQGGGLLQLKAEMQKQAEVLATRMASPKVVRILTHSLPQFETHSLDVLTGKVMILGNGMAWEEDGKTVKEDSEPESELLDDEFSNYLDDSD